MGFFLRIDNEDMQQAIESHNYKPGFESISHAESQVEAGESYQIYKDITADGIDTDNENNFETVGSRQFQLVKSGKR